MALPDLTGQNIENTYQRVIQTDGTNFYDGTGSLVNFGEAVFPYTGSAIISGSLIVTGSTEIQYLTASGLNYPTIDGDEKQLITTDGSGNLSFDWSDRTNLDVKNTSGTTLALGTPVYISGFQGASIFQISPSSASISSSMPAVGVLSQELAPNEQGHATILGALRGYDTSLCSVNDSLYVGEGILTKDRPTGSALIQKIARVGNSQNNGEITIIGAGRSNDIPNLPPGYAWIGNDNWVATAVPTSSFNEDPFPYTGSAAISGALEVTGDVTIYGTASVDVLITNYESSSIIYSSGSTKFGDSLDDTHIFTGSVSVTGSLDVDNTITAVTGSFSHLKGNSPITVQDSVTFQSDITASQIQLGTATIYSGSTRTSIGIGYTPYYYAGNNAITADKYYTWGEGSAGSPSLYIGSNGGGAGRGIYGVPQGLAFSANNSTIAYIRGRTNDSSGVDTPRLGIGVNPSAHIDLAAHVNSTRDLLRISGSSAATHAEVFFISSSGNTGIGTWSPNYKLEVVGEVSASTYYGDGSNLTGIETDPFPYTGSAVISGSLEVTGSISSTDTVTAVTGSFSHLKGNSPITVQDPVTFQQTLSVTGNATLSSINEIDLQTISKDFSYTSSLVVAEITASVNGAIIDYRLTNLNSGSRVGTFMYAHDGTELSYNDLTIPGGGIGDQPILSASLVNDLVKIDIENAAGFNFTGYAKKFNRLANAIPVADPNVTYVLNQYPSENVVGAYSIRQLDQFYTGSAMRVREAGSNNEIDIEFDVNGYLDTLAIAAHCGSNIGYVTIWYDQSGNNNHLTQSVAGNQPKIYNGSSIYEVNGQPCLRTRDASSDPVLGGVTGIDYTGGISVYNVANAAGYGQNSVFLNPLSNGWDFRHGHSGVNPGFRVNNKTAQIPNPRNDQYQILESGFYDNSTGTIYTFLKQQYAGNFTPLQTGSATGVSLSTTTTSELQITTRAEYQELIIMNDYEISNREGIFTNINNYYNIYETGLLAEYGGAAASYSVRQLDSAYTGSALRIREDGTNTETDIGFDSNGDLDTASIASHCGANNGLVVTWYDQSGNGNDATQSTVGNQPKIYDSSTGIELENGKPIINLITGNSSTLLLDTQLTSSTTHIFGVAELDSTGNKVMIGVTNGGGLYIAANGDTNNAAVGSELYINSSSSTISTRDQVSDQFQTQTLFSSIQNLSSSGHDQTRIGMLNGGGDSYKMFNMQEIIFYNTSQSVDRDGIHNNINSYFNIYS